MQDRPERRSFGSQSVRVFRPLLIYSRHAYERFRLHLVGGGIAGLPPHYQSGAAGLPLIMQLNLSESSVRKLLVALGIYITALLASNTLGMKTMPLPFDQHLSVGIFMFPIVFLMTDVVGEVYGKKIAKWFVLAGIVSTALWIFYNFLSLALPWSDTTHFAYGAYETVFGTSVRIAIASIVAFAVAEYQDVLSFFFFKKHVKQGGFAVRSTLSNLWGQFLDTVLFMVIAFYGVMPTAMLVSVIFTWWLFKVAMGVVYTPLAYVGIRMLREKDDKKDAGTAG